VLVLVLAKLGQQRSTRMDTNISV